MSEKKSVLIFNRNNPVLTFISTLLQAEDYPVFETSLPLEAIHFIHKNNVDVVIASQTLDGMDRQEFKELAEKIRPGVNIFLLPDTPMEKGGDLIKTISDCKVNLKDLVQFIKNHIRTEGRSSRLKDFFFSFADRILQIFEVHDRYFFNNDHLVANLSEKIAMRMRLDEGLVDAIHVSALLRDIGRVGIQHEILDEKGRLEKNEFTMIESHPQNTVQIFKQINFPWNVESIILHHHEHYDGTGYPDKLKGRQIPLGSRIISLVDSYYAMITDRPYRKAISKEDAVQEILKKTGTQFDPEVVEVFFSVIREESIPADKKNLLVMDRDESVSALIKLNLSSNEFNALSSSTTPEAVKYLREENLFLVIGDWDTLASDRFHFYNVARQSNITNPLPFIIMVPQQKFPKQSTDPLVEFIAKPLNIDELGAKIKSISQKTLSKPQEKPSLEEQGIAGNLEHFSLADVIQVLNMGLKTAKIIIIREKEKGTIYIKYGRIVFAHLGRLTGNEAFFNLMGWNNGIFRIFHGHATDEINITTDTMALLLEASRVLDEKRRRENKGQAAT